MNDKEKKQPSLKAEHVFGIGADEARTFQIASVATGIEQDIIDAIKEQAEDAALNYNGDSRNWKDHLAPKAKAVISKMEYLINANK